MKGVFPRDENGNLKTKQGCQTPGCNWPNWHICLVGKTDTTAEVLAAREQRRRTLSAEQRKAISDGQTERWARINRENQGRNEAIISRYAQGTVSIKELRAEFNVGYQTMMNILIRAEKEGKIIIRKQGEHAKASTS